MEKQILVTHSDINSFYIFENTGIQYESIVKQIQSENIYYYIQMYSY